MNDWFTCASVQGEELNLDHKPKEIDYIIDAVRNEDKPFLFVCKE